MVVGQNEPTDASLSLMRVEMARMPDGGIAANTPPSPALTSFIAVTGSRANMGARATVSRSSSMARGRLALWM